MSAMENVADDLEAISATVAPNSMVPVIVGSNGPLTPQDLIRIEMLVTSLGGTVTKSSFDSINGYAAMIPADKIADLAHDAASMHMAPDRRVMPTMDVALPTIGGANAGPATPALGINLLSRIDDRCRSRSRCSPDRA